jgi:zinc protease
MIKYKSITLKSGLTVISDYIPDTPMATFSLGYKVGSKNEDPQLTGLAHLIEHLMFGGSKNVPAYDNYVEMAGGSSNAFTSADYTNYYITLPAVNIETAFFLESDRMFFPNLTEQTLEVQRKVVIEEYKERVLNPPYGDLMSNLLSLVYDKVPYRWPVIGADVSHIEKISIDDVKSFHDTYYCPSNAVIAVSGNVSHDRVFELAEKWFGEKNGSVQKYMETSYR